MPLPRFTPPLLLRVLGLLASAPLASANPNGLGLTPPQGWRSWNFMKQEVSQAKILDQVAALVARRGGRPSLLDAGYGHIGIDDGWQACGVPASPGWEPGRVARAAECFSHPRCRVQAPA
jgi:hypothetical protein